MIREACSCGAEFETDDREAIELVKSWRKTHKHVDRAAEVTGVPYQISSDTTPALGFKATQQEEENE